jgi:hypothetical protein
LVSWEFVYGQIPSLTTVQRDGWLPRRDPSRSTSQRSFVLKFSYTGQMGERLKSTSFSQWLKYKQMCSTQI